MSISIRNLNINTKVDVKISSIGKVKIPMIGSFPPAHVNQWSEKERALSLTFTLKDVHLNTSRTERESSRA